MIGCSNNVAVVELFDNLVRLTVKFWPGKNLGNFCKQNH